VSDSHLLAAAEDLRGPRSLATVALGAKSRLDRLVDVLEVPALGRPAVSGAWLHAALGLVSLRRTLSGLLAVAAASVPQTTPAPPQPPTAGLLR
jgi:hypothetical protein